MIWAPNEERGRLLDTTIARFHLLLRKRSNTIFAPVAIHLIAFVSLPRRVTISIPFCPLDGSDKFHPIHFSGFHAHLSCNFSNFLNSHFHKNNLLPLLNMLTGGLSCLCVLPIHSH